MKRSSVPTSSTEIASVPKKLTFEEYLFYQDNTDLCYELYRGKLIPMATATVLHTDICKYLIYQFQRHFATTNLALVATSDVGVRTEEDGVRIPDVVVCTAQIWERIRPRKGAGVLNFGEVPLIVVEVTSDNWREDYIRKRAEYALIEIPEYWIVDSDKQRIRVCIHPENEDGYEYTDFQIGQTIRSLQFPNLVLSVEEILSPPIVEDLIKAEQAQIQQLQTQVEQERERAEQERERADKLAQLLRERGIDPDLLA